MKNLYKKYEQLSAYLDNELSEAERRKIEEELKFSKELQNELNELKRMKRLTVQSVKSVPENPFFDTRLAATMRTGGARRGFFKRFSPVFGVIALSAILMVVLKYNPQIINRTLEQQKSNIADFYKQNLKPLLYAANLSNEDMFNFAFYHRLPLDNQKRQYLQLGSDPTGHQFFEIKSAAADNGQNNLAKFVSGLSLNKKQKLQMDSILASYADDLQSQVLVNEKNTVAINPNIWNYNKALAADLIAFAARANKREFEKVVPPGFNRYYTAGSVERMVNQVKSTDNNRYIFFTPDSIFSESFVFDKDKYRKDIKRMKDYMRKNVEDMELSQQEMKQNLVDMNRALSGFGVTVHLDSNITRLRRDSSWNSNFKVYFNGNDCRVHLEHFAVPQISIPNIEVITANVDSLTDLFRNYAFNFPKLSKRKNFNYKYFYHDSSKGFNYTMKAFAFDSTFKFGNSKIDSMYSDHLKRFKFNANPDSMAAMVKSFFGDSARVNRQYQLQDQLKEFQKEMEKFRQEMEKLQKELQMNQPKQGQKKSIEI